MNVLPFDKQVAIIAALAEGCSIRAVERLTGVHRDTIMRLAVRVGQGCARLHDRNMLAVRPTRIEMDEVWSYVGKKRRKVTQNDNADVVGDQYVFTAIDATSKAFISYRIGKRDHETTEHFVWDLRDRVLGRPEISSDNMASYESVVDAYFGNRCHYGQIVKKYVGEPGKDAARRYSPGVVVAVARRRMIGQPQNISTSYVERSNLTIRMSCRRFTRLTNAFSKKLENHAAAVSLFVAHFNWCRVHEATRTTPAVGIGIADHVWSIGELVAAALGEMDRPEKGRTVGPFTVIEGGRA